MYDLLSFGELLLRFSPSGNKRFLNADRFDCYLGGAELNVAAGVSQLGGKCGYISKIPSNAIGEMARRKVLSYKISDRYLLPDNNKNARMALYYYEKAGSPRKPEVIYDRENSSFQNIAVGELPEELWNVTRYFHTSGINLALGGNVRRQTVEMMNKFRENGVKISFDVNFRGNMWTGDEARNSIEKILPMVDIFFCTEETARLTFGKMGSAEDIMRSFADEYGISYVCSSKRTVYGTKDHSFNSCIYERETGSFCEGKPYEHIEVADRIGSGDAFVAGVLYGLLCHPENLEAAVKYGNAMGALKNTAAGDLADITAAEVEEVIANHEAVGYIGELKR